MTRHTIAHKSREWLILQCLKDFGAQPRHQLTTSGSDDEAKAGLSRLSDNGFIRLNGEGCYGITMAGLRKLREINGSAEPARKAGKRELGRWHHDQVYRGEELRQTCLRPGAYDAFALPSLMMGERVYRREIPR